jgi:integrase
VKDAYEFVTFSPEQARRFLIAVRGDRLEALYVVGLTTGMREGELLGLRWADVDLDGALHITRRLKRRTSRRQVLLVAPAVQALKLHRERQEDERRRADPIWHDTRRSPAARSKPGTWMRPRLRSMKRSGSPAGCDTQRVLKVCDRHSELLRHHFEVVACPEALQRISDMSTAMTKDRLPKRPRRVRDHLRPPILLCGSATSRR